jgi:glycosyltransferase involved in cell wall biosynthesis
MTSALFFFAIFLLWIALANFITIRRPGLVQEIDKSVSVLIPVRNEAENINELVDCLTKQSHLKSLEIIFIDDSSTDSTNKLLKTARSEGAPIKMVDAPELPVGWLGKPWALQQGYLIASGEIIVTIDADVRLTPTAIAQAIAMMGKRDFILLIRARLRFHLLNVWFSHFCNGRG